MYAKCRKRLWLIAFLSLSEFIVFDEASSLTATLDTDSTKKEGGNTRGETSSSPPKKQPEKQPEKSPNKTTTSLFEV